MEWDVNQPDKPCGEPISTYGPYACKAIPKILSQDLNGQELLVFSGGLPRGNYGDKYAVSVIHGENHVALDFTSKVWIFHVIISYKLRKNLQNSLITLQYVLTNLLRYPNKHIFCFILSSYYLLYFFKIKLQTINAL